MKFNWGTGIAVFFTLFVLALAFQVYKSTQFDHSLVSDHYYADDLAYQQHYEKLANAQQLGQNLKIWNKLQKEEVELAFPEEVGEVSGEVYFFCPSDRNSDFRLAVQAGPGHVQRISTHGLRRGLWRVKVDWQSEGKAYYTEDSITL
ncbi:MAG: FixH family protein [Phaeodactylibacter sp.]|nr:FixH family protein [Phaeodactylibacter sp.]MCB9273177.1 FixH family protein [Lewinellaceae bacterium]